jgi:hypothetical protein
MPEDVQRNLSDGHEAVGAADEIEKEVEADSAGSGEPPREFRYLAEKEQAQGIALRQLFAEQEHGLRQKYADGILWLLGAQFLVADSVFVAVAWAGWSWALTPGVIEVWMAATVVRVVGVVAVVTRHLFPNRDGEEVKVA